MFIFRCGYIDSEWLFYTTVYHKRDDFNFRIVNFPFMSSNILAGPSYGIYISQSVRIGRISNTYDEFVKRHLIITSRFIKQGFRYTKLVKSFMLNIYILWIITMFVLEDKNLSSVYWSACVIQTCHHEEIITINNNHP